jgi:signal transduction histidine kinase
VFKHAGRGTDARLWRGTASAEELVGLLDRFLGRTRARQQLAQYAAGRGIDDWRGLPVDAELVRFAETQLSGAIGSASARVMVASVAKEEDLGLDEVLDILDEATQVRAYSRELEAKQRELETATAELREANERLRELDRMKDDFISTVTHELRTPLTSIRALSEMLHEDPEIDIGDRTRFLGIIVNEAERLTRLINQILDMAKLESGRAEWTTSEVDVAAIVREAMDSLGQLFRGQCAGRPRRPRPPDPGHDQPAVECGEVRSGRQRPGQGARRGRRARRPRRGDRQRARPDPGRVRRHLREVPPGRQHDDRQASGYGPRLADQPADRRVFWW